MKFKNFKAVNEDIKAIAKQRIDPCDSEQVNEIQDEIREGNEKEYNDYQEKVDKEIGEINNPKDKNRPTPEEDQIKADKVKLTLDESLFNDSENVVLENLISVISESLRKLSQEDAKSLYESLFSTLKESTAVPVVLTEEVQPEEFGTELYNFLSRVDDDFTSNPEDLSADIMIGNTHWIQDILTAKINLDTLPEEDRTKAEELLQRLLNNHSDENAENALEDEPVVIEEPKDDTDRTNEQLELRESEDFESLEDYVPNDEIDESLTKLVDDLIAESEKLISNSDSMTEEVGYDFGGDLPDNYMTEAKFTSDIMAQEKKPKYTIYGVKNGDGDNVTPIVSNATFKRTNQVLNDIKENPKKYEDKKYTLIYCEDEEGTEIFGMDLDNGNYDIYVDKTHFEQVDYDNVDDEDVEDSLYNNIYADLVSSSADPTNNKNLGNIKASSRTKLTYDELGVGPNGEFVVTTVVPTHYEHAKNVCDYYNGTVIQDTVTKDNKDNEHYHFSFKVDGVM